MSKKQELARFRNLTKGKLAQQKGALNNLTLNLPNDMKSLAGHEKYMISQLKEIYRDILGTWDRNTQELLNQIEE